MSRENVELVRLAYERLNARDADAFAELCDDDFLIDMSGRTFNPETYVGRDGIRRFLADVGDAWESYRWNLADAIVVDDRVLANLHCEAQGRDGVRTDWHVAWVWVFNAGSAVSVRFYRDPEEAIEAVGLSKNA